MAFTTPPTPEQFTAAIIASELMTASELSLFMAKQFPKGASSSSQLAYELVRQNVLTKYQAQVLYQGRRSRPLVLGNYIILERLGAGGMGQVYKAKHRRMGRVVALKVLPLSRSEENHDDAIRRFQREVEAAARLVHSNIVTAYDADFAKGCHFLVMEYVDGMNLSQYVKEKGPFPPDQTAACIVQAARGLAYAHSAGVIHRDIKPSNLLLDSRGIVRVLDMGLARIEEAMDLDSGIELNLADGNTAVDAGNMNVGGNFGAKKTTNHDDLTQVGSVMGSVDYMPPEQGMDMRQTTQLSDVYSLGGTLYYLLTGHPMYSGKTVVERIMAHRDRPIPSLCENNSAVPVPLDRFYQRMVAKSPLDRPSSMNEVITGIESIFLSPGGFQTNDADPSGRNRAGGNRASRDEGQRAEEGMRMEEAIPIAAHVAHDPILLPPSTMIGAGEPRGAAGTLLDEWILDDISSTQAPSPPMRLGGYGSYRRRERQLYRLVGVVAAMAFMVIVGVSIYDMVRDRSAAHIHSSWVLPTDVLEDGGTVSGGGGSGTASEGGESPEDDDLRESETSLLAEVRIVVSEPDATIQIFDEKSGEKLAEQKLLGRREFETHLPAGDYRVEVQKDGFATVSQPLHGLTEGAGGVGEGSVRELRVSLSPG